MLLQHISASAIEPKELITFGLQLASCAAGRSSKTADKRRSARLFAQASYPDDMGFRRAQSFQ